MNGKKAKALRRLNRNMFKNVTAETIYEDEKPHNKLITYFEPPKKKVGEKDALDEAGNVKLKEDGTPVKESIFVRIPRYFGNPFRTPFGNSMPLRRVMSVSTRVLGDCQRKYYQKAKSNYKKIKLGMAI